MKRDWNLIREILLDIEEHGMDDDEKYECGFGKYTSKQYSYHFGLMFNAGFINNSGLINKGIEFLDKCRNDDIWKKVTKQFKDKNIGMCSEVLIYVLDEENKMRLQNNENP